MFVEFITKQDIKVNIKVAMHIMIIRHMNEVNEPLCSHISVLTTSISIGWKLVRSITLDSLVSIDSEIQQV